MLKMEIEWVWTDIEDTPPPTSGMHYWFRERGTNHREQEYYEMEEIGLYFDMEDRDSFVQVIDCEDKIPLSDFSQWAGPIPYMPNGE